MKKVMVTSCSQSHGRPMVRVTTSHTTVSVKPVLATPHSTISARSSGSSQRHFRCRCDSCSNATARDLLDAAHQLQDLHGVGPELAGDLVLEGLAHGFEARLVHAGDDLHAHLLQARARLALH